MFIFGQIESGNEVSAAAVSVLLLVIALLVLVLIQVASRWSSRHDR